MIRKKIQPAGSAANSFPEKNNRRQKRQRDKIQFCAMKIQDAIIIERKKEHQRQSDKREDYLLLKIGIIESGTLQRNAVKSQHTQQQKQRNRKDQNPVQLENFVHFKKINIAETCANGKSFSEKFRNQKH